MSAQNEENNIECFKRLVYPEAFQFHGIGVGFSPIAESMFGKGNEWHTFSVVEENGEYYLHRAVSHFSGTWKGKQHEAPKKIGRFGNLLNQKVFESPQWEFMDSQVFGKSSAMIEARPGTHLTDLQLIFRMPTEKGNSFWAQKGYIMFYLVILN